MSGLLRKLQLEDLSIIRRWRNDPKVSRFMFSQHDISEEEHLAWYDNSQRDSLRYLVGYEIDNELNGFLQLQKKALDCDVYEWGFYINPKASRGTGSKLATCALQMAFSELNALKVYGEVLAFNKRSIKLHNNFGFFNEGVLRKQCFLNGNYQDVNCYGLLRSEWLKGM